MQQITIRLEENTIESLEGEAETQSESRSEYLRDIIDSRHEADELRSDIGALRTNYKEELAELRAEHKTEIDEYEEEISALQARVDDLERQLMAANSRIDASNDLVERVEEEQSLARRKAEAGLVTRAKWTLFGMDVES